MTETRRAVRQIHRRDEFVRPIRRGSSVWATEGWDRDLHPLTFEINSPWSVTQRNTPSHFHHREDMLYTLMRMTKGHFYHFVEVRDRMEVVEGYEHMNESLYEWRYTTLFESRDDAMIGRLSLIY